MSQKKKTICSAVGFLCIAAVIVCAGELVPRSSMFRTVLQLGAIYALLAVSLDLVWGYAGILSLGHAAFFALGAYVMGMHLMREIGARGVYDNPELPDFMVFLN